MKREEFRKLAIGCGYNTKDAVDKWLKENIKNDYDDEDFIEVYRFCPGKKSPKLKDLGSGCYTTKRYKPLGFEIEDYEADNR